MSNLESLYILLMSLLPIPFHTGDPTLDFTLFLMVHESQIREEGMEVHPLYITIPYRNIPNPRNTRPKEYKVGRELT